VLLCNVHEEFILYSRLCLSIPGMHRAAGEMRCQTRLNWRTDAALSNVRRHRRTSLATYTCTLHSNCATGTLLCV